MQMDRIVSGSWKLKAINDAVEIMQMESDNP